MCIRDSAFSVQVDLTATWEQEWERSYQTDWQSVWNSAWPQRYDDLRPDVPTGIRARIYTCLLYTSIHTVCR